jgi:RNA polymerase sigma factor (sigma-70 family)
MKNLIPDEEIKGWIRTYQTGRREVYREIASLLSSYIYNYPRVVFGSDADLCSDFYEYLFRRLERILISYRETEAKFVTWFTVVLRRRYLNFLRERRVKGRDFCEGNPISLDSSDADAQSLYNVIAERRDFVHSDQEKYDALLEMITCGLNVNQRVFFHLYYLDSLRPEDVIFLSVTLNRPVRQTMAGIDELKDSVVHRYEKKQESFEKLNQLYRRLVRAQRERDRDAERRYRQKRSRVLEEYRRIKIHPSYERLAHFLDIPLGTVSTGVARMKRAVRMIVEDRYHEKLPL